MKYLLRPLGPYRDLFRGRASRSQFWLFQLWVILGTIALVAAVVMLFMSMGFGAMMGQRDPQAVAAAFATLLVPLVLASFLAIFGYIAVVLLSVASLGMQVKRLHDQDLSGWLVLIGFIPYIGWLVIIVMMCLPGTRGPNRHGPVPDYDRDPMADLADRFA